MIKCSICGREFTREVNKNMHEKYCKNTDKNTNDTNKKITNKKIINKEIINKKNGCEHNYILLDDRIETHRQAKKSGYNAYCSKCDELT